MASRTGCCRVTVGSGVMSQGWSTSLWVTFSCPLGTGSGRRTGMWMKTLKGSPQKKGSVLKNHKKKVSQLTLALSHSWSSMFLGMDICHWFSSYLHKRQKMEFLRASPQMDTIQKVQGTGHLGQGVYQHIGLKSNYISYHKCFSLMLMKKLISVCPWILYVRAVPLRADWVSSWPV